MIEIYAGEKKTLPGKKLLNFTRNAVESFFLPKQ